MNTVNSNVNFLGKINIFSGIREPNVTFCLDISGSMYNMIDTIKEQLIEFLLDQSVLAKLNFNRMFNLIAFSTEVYPWANGMVLWNTSTVNSAINWIRDLETKTGTNTLDALVSAFHDEQCTAICLITDDVSDQEPYAILNQISALSRGRPVHCIYVSSVDRAEDRAAIEFLQNLSSITRGYFKIVSMGRQGLEKITPVSTYDYATAYQLGNLTLNANTNHLLTNAVSTSSIASQYVQRPIFTTTNGGASLISSAPSAIMNRYVHPKWLNEPASYAYPKYVSYPRVLLTGEGRLPSKSIAWSRFRPVRVSNDGTVLAVTDSVMNSTSPANDIAYTPDAGTLLVNRNVLARSQLDGNYYKGKVINQILAHRFTVQFDSISPKDRYKNSYFQDTAVYDIIHYEDAISHPVRVNDRVLALTDSAGYKYAPAEVLDGFEKRNSNDENDRNTPDSPLIVRFSNGKTRTLRENEAVWLPDAMYERIKFEFNLPTTARQYLEEANDDYPNKSLPGYPTVQAGNASGAQDVLMPRLIYDIWPYYVPYYPHYSNIISPGLCGSQSAATISTSSLYAETQPIQMSNVSSVPVYHRQLKLKQSQVDANCINKSVVGSILTPEELDRKIRDQIYQHRHLLEECVSRSRSESRSRSRSHSRSRSACGRADTAHTTTTVTKCHNCHCGCLNTNVDENSHVHDDVNQYDNNHYQAYREKVNDLYRQCKHNHMSRSKSVTFSENDLSNKFDQHHHHAHNHDHSIDYDSDYDDYVKFRQIPKKKKNSIKKSVYYTNKPDRFGNPNVNVGLPEKPLMYRSKSALDNLDASLVDKNMSRLNEEARRRQNVARREQTRVDRLAEEQKKSAIRDEYKRTLNQKLIEIEKTRDEQITRKNLEKSNAKRDIKAALNDRLNANKIDIEAKEEKKIAHLRSQALKRDTEYVNNLNNQAFKEAQKLAFKKTEQDKRNQSYHDRLVVEEAYRVAQQKQALSNYEKQKSQQVTRENKQQIISSLNKSLTDDNLVKLRTNVLNC